MAKQTVASIVSHKLLQLELDFLIMGMCFFVLACAIVIFPQLVQILFVFGFFLVSFSALFISIKISHLRDTAQKLLPGGKKK